MIENQPNMQEMGLERFPNPEEIQAGFERLVGKEYTETRKLEDENGIYLWEVTVPGEDEGQVMEYTYDRNNNGALPKINLVQYENGMPTGGESMMTFIDSEWVMDNDRPASRKKFHLPLSPMEALSELRESQEEVETLESLFKEFEVNHSLLVLLSLRKMTREEAESHTLRESARLDLIHIDGLLKILKAETDVSQEKYDELFAKYTRLSKAVGRHTNKNIIEH